MSDGREAFFRLCCCFVFIQRLQLLLTLVSGLEQICFDLELVSYYSQYICEVTCATHYGILAANAHATVETFILHFKL